MIKLEFDPKSVEALLERGRNLNLLDQGKAVYRGFVRAGLLIERALKGNISGAYLDVRSGRLRSSIGSQISFEDGGLKAVIGSGARQGDRVKYANIHETGGTIVPRVRQWLTVPLEAAKTPSGVGRFTAQDVRRKRTQYTGSFIQDHVIFGYMKRGQYKTSRGLKLDIVPLFVLKKSVTIPASRYLSRTSEETFADANKMILDTVKEELSK